MNKTSLYLAAFMVLMAGILSRVRAAIQLRVPEGYQDETGFHLGVQKPGKTPPWPPVW